MPFGYLVQFQVDSLLSFLSREELEKPRDQFHKHNLVSILDSAIRSSCMHTFPEHILDCLEINKVIEEKSKSLLSNSTSLTDLGFTSNWELVELEYRVPPPLDAAFGTDVICSKRRKIFRFLWKLKRVQHILSKTWRSIASASRQLRSVPEIKGVLHTAQILSNEMVHFVYNFQYYIMFEVLESSWKQFTENSSKARSLDALIHAHDSYLDSIIAGALLIDELEVRSFLVFNFEALLIHSTPQQPPAGAAPFTPRTKDTKAAQLKRASAITLQISNILNAITQFDGVFGTLYALSLEVANRRAAAAKGGKWGNDEDEEEADAIFNSELTERVQAPLSEIATNYRKYFSMLHRSLRVAPVQSTANNQQRLVANPKLIVDEYLSHLAFRLDYSSFYKGLYEKR